MNEIHIFIDHIGDPAFLAHHFGSLFYVITFFWTAFEGETFVIIAGLLAQKGYLNIGGLFVAAWLGSFCGDQVVFALGRRFGTRILHRFPKLEPGVERAIGWLERYAVAFILSYRFIYGLRNVSGIAVGLSHIPWKKFVMWNATAAAIWAAAFCGFGYFCGDVLGYHLHHEKDVVNYNVREVMISALGLFIFVVGAKYLISWFCRDRRRKPLDKQV